MNNKTHKKMLLGGVVVTLSFLPGCTEMFKGGGTSTAPVESRVARESAPLTGQVLVTMKGAPAITTDSLEKEREKLIKANPQIRQAMAFIDAKELDRNILNGLIEQRIIDEYIVANKINETAAYRAELQDLYESMERLLNAKIFSERNPATVSEAEIKSFYDTNKDKSLRISQGGVVATGLEFKDGATARAFAARAKNIGLKKVAQDDGLLEKVKDFKVVNKQSIGIDEQLRDKIAAITTVPTTEVFEINGSYWVISATAKEEPKYVAYDQIKDRIREQLEQQKRMEANTKDIERLKKEYGVEINEDYFKTEETPEMSENAQAMTKTSGLQAPEKEQRLA